MSSRAPSRSRGDRPARDDARADEGSYQRFGHGQRRAPARPAPSSSPARSPGSRPGGRATADSARFTPRGRLHRPPGRLLAGRVGVEAEPHLGRPTPQKPDLIGGQGGAHAGDRRLHAGRDQPHHVRVPLGHDEVLRAGSGRPRLGQPEEQAALLEMVALGRIHVLRPLARVERPPAEALHAALAVGDREHDPGGEEVARPGPRASARGRRRPGPRARIPRGSPAPPARPRPPGRSRCGSAARGPRAKPRPARYSRAGAASSARQRYSA